VRFDPEMVLETIKTCPSEFKLHARNPAHTLNIGGDWMAFGSVASPPNFMELDGTRHAGNRQNFQDLLKLTQMFNIVHFTAGYPVEPVDLHASIRHIECSYDMLTMTDKAIHCYSLGRQRNQDVLEMSRIARQVSPEQLDKEPSVFSIINSSSPLRLDIPMLQGIMEFSSRNQIIIITPFTLAGAMAPITLAGALAQQNAEALAGMVFTQLVRPGAPVAYGGFTSNVDMHLELLNTCAPQWQVANSLAATTCHTDRAMCVQQMHSMLRPHTKVCFRYGERFRVVSTC
jgi:trimethylamine--corrinoid protein Co-methyltransferase